MHKGISKFIYDTNRCIHILIETWIEGTFNLSNFQRILPQYHRTKYYPSIEPTNNVSLLYHLVTVTVIIRDIISPSWVTTNMLVYSTTRMKGEGEGKKRECVSMRQTTSADNESIQHIALHYCSVRATLLR